ncbi:MAG: class I SAM-dependent methyltransferase [Candidatus Bathyarchaeota archaeon]|nr:class I SAM-dependent methyltransferase [Candidatus Bathyarchaeota archaeon]
MPNHKYPGAGKLRRMGRKPEVTLSAIGLRSGMVFMDIGCGDGFFTIPAAQLVGEAGRVYAVDADAAAVEKLRDKAAEKGLTNITAKLGLAEETVFCEVCADIVFYSRVLHDFKDPARVLRNAKQMLKPTGRLVNLDWKKKPTMFGPPVRIRFSEEQAADLIKAAGFTIESVASAGRNFYIITAKP